MPLVIPPSVIATRQPQTEKKLTKQAREWLEGDERSPGIHASDLLDIRQAYWRHVDPQGLSDREVWTFLIGKVLHAFTLSAIDERELSWQSGEKSRHSKLLEIDYSPDKLTKKGVPRELKTTRSFYAPKEDDEGRVDLADIEVYIEQCLIYMAAENKTEGMLDILYLNLKDEKGRTTPQMRSYKVVIDESDLEKMQTYLKRKRDRLEAAIKSGNFQELPLCRLWKCSERMCAWWSQCKPEGRYGVEKEKKGRKK